MTDEAAQRHRQAREMGRLATLIDAVFAIVLVLPVADAPRRDQSASSANPRWC